MCAFTKATTWNAVSHPCPPPVPFVPDVSEGVGHRLKRNITKGTGVDSSRIALGALQQIIKKKVIQIENLRLE